MEHEHHHHHTHHEHCGCGHDHHEHEHHQHHAHDDACGCGHDHHEHEHHHHHEHSDSCGCGHDHHDHEHHHHSHEEVKQTPPPVTNAKQVIFILENLGCPNCAMKMEAKIQALPGVEYASVTYATKQLRIAAPNVFRLLPDITAICQSIEPDVQVVLMRRTKKSAEEREMEAARESVAFQKDLAVIAAGGLTLAAGLLLQHFALLPDFLIVVMLLFAYALTGKDVLLEAFGNMKRGQIFDENFLMSIATIGALFVGSWEEAVGVMLFYRIGQLFEDMATRRSRSQIMDAVDLRPEVVHRVTGDTVTEIPAEQALIGDILLIRPGDRVPLDGTIIDGESFMDTSAITGEPVPIRVRPGHTVTSGWVNKDGLLKLRVDKYLHESMVTRILDAVENAAASKPSIDKFITRFCRVYTPAVCAIALATAIVPSLVTGDWSYWVYTALNFLVISCPCALVLSVPLAFFCGIGSGSKQGILFKGGAALEALCKVKAVAMDKTGTLTKGSFTVQEVLPAEGMVADRLLALAAACEAGSTHPIAKSILTAAEHLTVPHAEQVTEVSGQGIIAVIDGAGVLCGNAKLLAERGISVPAAHLQGTQVLLAKDGAYVGCIRIDDALKADAPQAVAALKAKGITTAMLTGDAEDSAKTMAGLAGIDRVHAKLLPGEKFTALEDIRAACGPVMFVGDGINDAPVLAGADVGAAMGTGADAAIEAADVVFMTGDVSAVPKSIAIAKRTNAIAKQNVVIALAIKLGVMALGFAGFANMWVAVFADTGVAMICILNSIRILYAK